MNEMTELEILLRSHGVELRSWAPRRPSARLRRRLFNSVTPQVTRDAGTPDTPRFRFAWLAPATAAFLLMAVLFNQRNSPVISGSATSTGMVAMILSNQSPAAYLPAGFEGSHNLVPGETFEWTNGSGSTSSMRSLSPAKGINWQ